ncbi:MAG TPA: mannitol dehydrogenase family protein [Candidatus Competibacteraceae bacterium]|nr:mannitol dehydrogenase family protein [Candidatus Competibacteraceae bacterium]
MSDRLSLARLAALRPQVSRPAYDPARLGRGIVHLGIGAFHRAHQALYTDAVIGAGDLRWGIIGVSLRGTAVREALLPQDCLYSVLERHGEVMRARVVGAVRTVLHAPSMLDAVLQALADPAVQVVTITVTEKGYCQHPATGDLDIRHPDIVHDLAHADAPRSTLGVLAAGIRRRAAQAPLTVLCCDNMADNGDTVRKLLAQFAGLSAPGLVRRIETEIAFPNSMVDRIVPAATPESLAWAQAQLGLRDEAAIVCEPFTQWVIEDRFAGARPAWERVGALLTDDVRPYQAMKLRLLNGSHSAIAYLGQLRGLETVAEVMADAVLGTFVRRLMTEDLRATVAAPAGYDVLAYCHELLHRFENPTLQHRTEQIAMDGTQKVPVRWLPGLRESLASGIERPRLERALATWLHYLGAGRAENGNGLRIDDPGAAALGECIRAAGGEAHAAIRAALAHAPVFGREPWPEAFVSRLAAHLATLRRGGVRALLQD